MLDFSVTFIITLFNIAILFLILRAILFKPVTKFMADRAQKVQSSINQAESDKARAKQMLADYEEKLKNAEADVKDILRTAQKNAQIYSEQIVAEGKREAENIIALARKQADAERAAALAKFRIEAAALVLAASAKLASRDFSGEDNRRYANMLLEEIAAQKGNG